jgi:hypothetical protein
VLIRSGRAVPERAKINLALLVPAHRAGKQYAIVGVLQPFVQSARISWIGDVNDCPFPVCVIRERCDCGIDQFCLRDIDDTTRLRSL